MPLWRQIQCYSRSQMPPVWPPSLSRESDRVYRGKRSRYLKGLAVAAVVVGYLLHRVGRANRSRLVGRGRGSGSLSRYLTGNCCLTHPRRKDTVDRGGKGAGGTSGGDGGG